MGQRKKDLIALKAAKLLRGGKPAKPDAKTSPISYGTRAIPTSSIIEAIAAMEPDRSKAVNKA